MEQFVDREGDLDQLTQCYKSETADFVVSEGVLSDLERTAAEVRWSKEPADGATMYALFSRSGYTTDLNQAADTRDDVSLFELVDIF